MKKTCILFIIVIFFLLSAFFLLKNRTEVDLTKVSFSGKSTYWVEIADTPQKAEIGLMWRKNMPQNQGMLFIFPYPHIIKMWMKNTYIPLDMIFLNAQRQVICLRENARPLDESIISCPYPAKMVLELNAGEIKTNNIQLGDYLLSP